jgi:hypothetical protein
VIVTRVASAAPGAGYTIEVTDCTNPSKVRSYNKGSLCQTLSPIDEQPIDRLYTVLQQSSTRRIKGYSCEVTVSTYWFKCGVWSHLKMQQVPEILRHKEVSTAACRKLSTTREFEIANYANPIQVRINHPTYVPVSLTGSLTMEDDVIKCQGQDVLIGGKLHKDTLQLAEYRILLKEEIFLENGGKVESQTDHISLDCPYDTQGCITGGATYVWERVRNACPLSVINTIRPSKTLGTYLVDHNAQMLLNTTGETTITYCPFRITRTDHDGIFLADSGSHMPLPTIEPTEVDINLQAAVHLNYLAYTMKSTLGSLDTTLRRTICESHYRSVDNQPVLLHEDIFGMMKGDLLLTFACKKEAKKIREEKFCYEDIPVEPVGFADARTKHLVMHSTKVTCSDTFPLTVKAREGWVQITPTLKIRPEPLEMTETSPTANFTDFSHGGLYTEQETADWLHTITFPSYATASLQEIAYGLCVGTGNCEQQQTAGLPIYTLDNLIPDLEKKLNIWGRLKDFLHEWGDLMALLCLVILGIKFLADLVCIVLTMLRVGPGAALALIGHLYLYNRKTYRKIMKRSQTNNKQERRTSAATEAPEAQQPLIRRAQVEPRGIELRAITTGAGDQGRIYIRYNLGNSNRFNLSRTKRLACLLPFKFYVSLEQDCRQ